MSSPIELNELDRLTGGAFSAATSADRAQKLRLWLDAEPAEADLQAVFKVLSARDKGAAKILRERLDALRKLKSQNSLAEEWAQKGQQLLALKRLNIADAMAWQRDAAKAQAPLSREPLASLKNMLSERVSAIEELQHAAMSHKEAAVLLTQRMEVLTTKPSAEAQQALLAVQADIEAWHRQAQTLQDSSHWESVDLRVATQLATAQTQLRAFAQAFEDSLAQALRAASDPAQALPPVPVWADEIRALRGAPPEQTGEAETPSDAQTAAQSRAERSQMVQERREAATAAVMPALLKVEAELGEGHSKASAGAAAALRAALKTHGRHVPDELDARIHVALTSAGELEGWQRWRADQLRQELVIRAEALMKEGQAQLQGRKMQDALRLLRQEWRQADQGGAANHALWKRFDAACTAAHAVVQTWLEQVKAQSMAQREQRLHIMADLQQLGERLQAEVLASASTGSAVDWRSYLRSEHDLQERWRTAGHLSEKAYAELQTQWKQGVQAARAPLAQAQKNSMAARQELIAQAQAWAEQQPLHMDALKHLQQQWQHEAQAVPLDRKVEQKLWETFKAPIDAAFARKSTERAQAATQASQYETGVMQAVRDLQAAARTGDAQAIRTAMQALELATSSGAALSLASAGPASVAAPAAQPTTQHTAPEQAAQLLDAQASETAHAGDAVSAPSSTPEFEAPAVEAPAVNVTETGAEPESKPEPKLDPKSAPSPRKALVAVRGDDRPGAKKDASASRDRPERGPKGERRRTDDRRRSMGSGPGAGTARDARDSRDGRGARDARDAMRADRPRLSDRVFRAQRDALEQAQLALRKLAAQAHGEVLTHVMQAWQLRDPEMLPAAKDLGRGLSAAQRSAWAQTLGAPALAEDQKQTALLRLELAAEVPTPAAQLEARRALQLQLLTRKGEAPPAQTWGQDAQKVLAAAYDEGDARRLQAALKVLLRR